MTVYPTVDAAAMNYIFSQPEQPQAPELPSATDLHFALTDLRFRANLIKRNANDSAHTLTGSEADAFKIGYARQGYIQISHDIDRIIEALTILEQLHGR